LAKYENFEVLFHQLGKQQVQDFEFLADRNQVITFQKRGSRFYIVK